MREELSQRLSARRPFLTQDYPDDYHDYHDFDYGIRFSSYTSFHREIYVKNVYLSDKETKSISKSQSKLFTAHTTELFHRNAVIDLLAPTGCDTYTPDDAMAITILTHTHQPECTCPCGSWLRHWEKASFKRVGCCAEVLCMNQAVSGIHVRMESRAVTRWYIVPMCAQHAQMAGTVMEIAGSTIMVSADPNTICGNQT